jgi:hypothetical protein
MIKTIACRCQLAALATLLAVTACAAASQPYLDAVKQECQWGDRDACARIPSAQSQVNAEHNDQAAAVATGFLAVLGAVAMGAAAGYAASHPVYEPTVVVICHWNC